MMRTIDRRILTGGGEIGTLVGLVQEAGVSALLENLKTGEMQSNLSVSVDLKDKVKE